MSDVRPALSRGAVDRQGLRRDDDAWLRTLWGDPSSRVLVLRDGQVAVDEGPHLALVPPAEAPEGDRYLLGVEDGVAYWAIAAEGPAAAGSANLRQVGALLGNRDAGLLAHAVALANWHATHLHCPRCGAPTRVERAGHVRRCEADGSLHFPRVDPAVIMLVHNGDRCVLGRQRVWPPRRYSVLAGFVEPGESLEQAVAREVAEEVGLAVTDITYRSSQPWPFPCSLMLGFTARAVATDRSGDLTLDHEELEDARWFDRADVAAAAAAGDRGTSDLLLPAPVSIAWRLLTDWLAAS